MKTQDAIDHFGTRRKLAETLGISTQSTHLWGENVPKGRAYELQVITNGALIAEYGGAEDGTTASRDAS